MAKGGKREGAGRPEGSTNKATQSAREAIAGFVEGNVERLNGWLDAIAQESPKDAYNCFMSVVEYHIPKLARQELTTPPGQPIQITLSEADKEIIARHNEKLLGAKK